MDVVEINGKMYPKEDVEKAQKLIMELWDNITEVFYNIFEAISSAVETFIKVLSERGYTEEQAIEYLETVIQNE